MNALYKYMNQVERDPWFLKWIEKNPLKFCRVETDPRFWRIAYKRYPIAGQEQNQDQLKMEDNPQEVSDRWSEIEPGSVKCNWNMVYKKPL